eukprot:Nitzschia sp. Nitz4//scaffold123_size70294//69283//70224//NITZ4_005937-RA/size70294-processed-gene-0.30-mRNA-1//-1//CDS//3329534512//2255//frame0
MMFVFWFLSFVSLAVALENGSGTNNGGMTTSTLDYGHIPALLVSADIVKTGSSKRALDQTYEVGTNVADYFDDDGGWSTGSVVSIDGDTYTIQWSDSGTSTYDLDEMDEIVDNYNAGVYDESQEDHEHSYEVGTNVADYFDDDGGWNTGSVLTISGDVYIIQWADGSTTRYDSDEMDEIVENYNSGAFNQIQWSSGTRVADIFDDDEKWHYGSIVGYDDGVYTIEWEDGSTAEYSSDDIDKIVIKGQSALSLGGIIFIVFLVLVVACCAHKWVLNRRRKKHRFNEIEIVDGNIASYADDPTGEGAFSDSPKMA